MLWYRMAQHVYAFRGVACITVHCMWYGRYDKAEVGKLVAIVKAVAVADPTGRGIIST